MFQRQRRRKRPSIWPLVLLLCLWGGGMGWGLAQAQQAVGRNLEPIAQNSTPSPAAPVGTVDVVPQDLQFPMKLYLERCGSCHVAIPPEVLPQESWRRFLLDPRHFNLTLDPLYRPEPRLIWSYLSTFSRTLREGEQLPYRIARSRFFKILHPRVEFPEPVTVSTCASCHPGAKDYNFRNLTAEWEDAS